jgi:hypothetical protein
MAVLPNIVVNKPIDGVVIALAPLADTRIQDFVREHPKFGIFQSRFSDAFGAPQNPTILIVQDSIPSFGM